MSRARPSVLLAICALLATCTSAERLAERNKERCAARGLHPKSDAFADCLVQLETESDRRREERRRAVMERSDNPLTRDR